MSLALQVLYPITDDTHFDYDYYMSTHKGLVEEHMGPHSTGMQITKGLAGGPDAPPGFYAIFTITFADKASMDAAMSAAGPVIGDIPNYTNTQPQMLIGEVLA